MKLKTLFNGVKKKIKFKKYCKECVKLDVVRRNTLILKMTAEILEIFREFSDNDAIKPANALAAIIMNAAIVDGAYNDKKMRALFPYLAKAAGGDQEFKILQLTYLNNAQGLKQLNNYTTNLLRIINARDKQLEVDILKLCILIMSSNGEVSKKERAHLTQQFGYLRI
ncbi:MAG: hypothetical protein K2L88_05435 [Clostridiales bacterium]|nr:hypothetical protein [Clostridiales bacterium]